MSEHFIVKLRKPKAITVYVLIILAYLVAGHFDPALLGLRKAGPTAPAKLSKLLIPMPSPSSLSTAAKPNPCLHPPATAASVTQAIEQAKSLSSHMIESRPCAKPPANLPPP